MRSLARGGRKGNAHKGLECGCCGKINVTSNYPTRLAWAEPAGGNKRKHEIADTNTAALPPHCSPFPLDSKQSRLRLRGGSRASRGVPSCHRGAAGHVYAAIFSKSATKSPLVHSDGFQMSTLNNVLRTYDQCVAVMSQLCLHVGVSLS